MKRALSLVLVMLIVLGCVSLVACGGEEKGVSTTQDSEAENGEAKSEEEVSTLSSGDGLIWEDMPIYSGAKTIAKGAWAIPAAEEDWSKVEWRYYETNDTLSEVTKFYKSQMPDSGWQETMWMDAGEMSWAFYQKNNEKDGAMIWINANNGNSVIALMRAIQ